jgi:hypothetical protein
VEAWEAARQQMLVKEKALMRARDALAAERRRMPWMVVEKAYEFEGPKGKVSLLDLFEGRRQLVVYRAFFEPGVFGWPEHACRGCSLGADTTPTTARARLTRSGSRCPTREPPSESAIQRPKHNRRPSAHSTGAASLTDGSPRRRVQLATTAFRMSSKVSKHLVRACLP